MIIDDASYANIVNTTLVRKLNLNTTKHYKPYRLQWLNKCGDVKANKQFLFLFFIGRHSDEVLCGVVLMYMSHLLLEGLRQFDKKVENDGFRNKYSFVKDGKSITLVSLSPKQVYED